MLQYGLLWGMIGLISGEVLQLTFRNRRFNEITWFGVFCFTAGFVRGYYNQDVYSLLRNHLLTH